MSELSAEEKERYSRHLRIPEWTEAEQLRLKQGSVLVIGMGGLGSPASMYLAAAGVGRIGLADFDHVESHNLQRQILYTEDQVGLKKAEQAKQRLLQMNGGIHVTLHEAGITQKNVEEIFNQYDVILDGSDNFDTRYLVNDATYLLKKPLVYGSVFRFEGQVMVLNHMESSPCYRCLFPEPPAPGTVPNCNEAGVVGALCGVVGSLQAMEVIKLLSGVGKVLESCIIKVDLMNGRFPKIAITKDKKCPLCGNSPKITNIQDQNYAVPCELPSVTMSNNTEIPIELPIEETHALQTSGDAYLLDVREPSEAEIAQIPGSLFIPMGQIPERVNEIPKDKRVIVYCHHGMRSLKVTHYLRSAGLENTSSMKGGIDAWALAISPDMARY